MFYTGRISVAEETGTKAREASNISRKSTTMVQRIPDRKETSYGT